MRIIVSLATILLSSLMAFAQQDDPVIMTINGNPIHRSEFEYSYNKNNAEDSFAEALGVMTNADIAQYGKAIGLDFASKATKASMIADILASDSDVNLELLSDEALRVMAIAEHLEVPEDATREELIDILGE